MNDLLVNTSARSPIDFSGANDNKDEENGKESGKEVVYHLILYSVIELKLFVCMLI